MKTSESKYMYTRTYVYNKRNSHGNGLIFLIKSLLVWLSFSFINFSKLSIFVEFSDCKLISVYKPTFEKVLLLKQIRMEGRYFSEMNCSTSRNLVMSSSIRISCFGRQYVLSSNSSTWIIIDYSHLEHSLADYNCTSRPKTLKL